MAETITKLIASIEIPSYIDNTLINRNISNDKNILIETITDK